MPAWLLLFILFAGFICWVGSRTGTRKPAEPIKPPELPQHWGGKALALLLLWRLGPMRSAALLSSLAAAWPTLSQWLKWGPPQKPSTSLSPDLSREEAARLLDIAPNATREEVESAYRHLMTRVHPDTGGNPYLAQLINAARDTLLS